MKYHKIYFGVVNKNIYMNIYIYIYCSTIVCKHPTITSIVSHSRWKSMLISSECPLQFSKDPTSLQSLTAPHQFCPATISSFLRSVDFSSCSKTQCVAFVSNTFSCVLSLCMNCDFNTKWQSCQPISHLELVHSLFGCLVVAFSEGDIEEHRSFNKSPLSCLGDRNSYPKAIWASVEDEQTKGRPCPHQNHEEKQVSLIVENLGRDDQANWTSYFCPHGPKTFASSWKSIKSSSQMPQTDSWSSPPTPSMGTINQELYIASCAKISFPGLGQLAKEILCVYMILPHTILHEIHAIF